MPTKHITILLVVFCMLAGTAVGGVASIPAAAPSIQGGVSGGAVAAVDSPVATTGGPPAAVEGSPMRVSDCDLIDIDGNANTVRVNLTSNATDGEDAGVAVRIHCGADNATLVDHDLIDIDGHNNTVKLVVQAENGAIVIGDGGSAADSGGLRVALNCGGGTAADCDVVDIDGDNNTVKLVIRSDDGRTVHEFGASLAARAGDELGENDEDDDGDGAIDEDDEGTEGPSNDDDDGDGAIDEDDEPDDGDDGADDFNSNAEDDDDGDGAVDEDDESDSGNSDDVDNDGDGAIDEDDERTIPESSATNGDN